MSSSKIITTPWAPNQGPDFDVPTFAIGDIHGQATALEALLNHLDTVCADDKTGEIIFTGDLIDRGPESFRSIGLALAACDRFHVGTILPGNHELMMMLCLLRKGTREDLDRWFHNGGEAMFDEVDPKGKTTSGQAFDLIKARLDPRFVEAIVEGDTHLVRNRVLFVHAGIHPEKNLSAYLDQPRFGPPHADHWAWMRHPFLSWEGGWAQHDLDLVVHGHSPATTKFIQDEAEAVFLLDKVDDFHCICLDAGSMSIPQVVAVEFRGPQHRLHVAQM